MWKIIVKATTNDKVTDVVHMQKKKQRTENFIYMIISFCIYVFGIFKEFYVLIFPSS